MRTRGDFRMICTVHPLPPACRPKFRHPDAEHSKSFKLTRAQMHPTSKSPVSQCLFVSNKRFWGQPASRMTTRGWALVPFSTHPHNAADEAGVSTASKRRVSASREQANQACKQTDRVHARSSHRSRPRREHHSISGVGDDLWCMRSSRSFVVDEP